MNTGAKLAIATVGAAIVVVVVYGLVKKSNKTVTSPVVGSGKVPILNYNDKKINVGGIGNKSTMDNSKAERFENIAVVNKADRFQDIPVVNKAERFENIAVVNKASRFN